MIQEAYASLFKEERPDVYKKSAFKQLHEITGIDPSEKIVQDAYVHFLRTGNVHWFGVLEEMTGIRPKPPEDEVQKAYAKNLIKGTLLNLEALRDWTGIEPRFSEDVVQDAYSECLRLPWQSYSEEQFKAILELGGIAPSEDTVQKAFAHHLAGGDIFGTADKLRELTGIEPSEDVVQEAYRSHIKSGAFDGVVVPNRFKMLQEMTGIEPEIPEDTVQAAYKKFLKANNTDKIKRLQELSGIQPELSEEDVQEAYAGCLKKGYVASIRQLQRLTGIEPEISEETVQEKYTEEFKKMNFMCLNERLEKLQKLTGIEPKPSEYPALMGAIQTWLYECAKQREKDKFKKLRELTGVKPDSRAQAVIQEQYSQYLDPDSNTWDRFSAVNILSKATGVEPAEHVIQSAYAQCLRQRVPKWSLFKTMQDRFRIRPSAAVYNLFFERLKSLAKND
jgi:hypothetical protein